MACPTCGCATMQNVSARPRLFWCPRCGTIKAEEVYFGSPEEHQKPRIDRPTLLKTIADNLSRLDAGSRHGEPFPISGVLWGKIAYVLGMGSTSAHEFCRAVGVDPHHIVGEEEDVAS